MRFSTSMMILSPLYPSMLTSPLMLNTITALFAVFFSKVRSSLIVSVNVCAWHTLPVKTANTAVINPVFIFSSCLYQNIDTFFDFFLHICRGSVAIQQFLKLGHRFLFL